MIEVKVRHENQPENKAVRLGYMPPNFDVEQFIEDIRTQGGIYSTETGSYYFKPDHRIVLAPGRCYLELICRDEKEKPTRKSRRKN